MKFVIENLNRSKTPEGIIFSYSPLDNARTYNASLLVSCLIVRGYKYTQNDEWLKLSKKSVNAVIAKQNSDGSWYYGADENQKWIDSFHTGYNLECIYEIMKYTNDYSYQNSFEKGFEYYINTFFESDGRPKHYHNNVYPLYGLFSTIYCNFS